VDQQKKVGRVLDIGRIGLCGWLLFSSCSQSQDAAKTDPGASEPAAKAAAAPFVPVDACSLLSKDEVQTITGKTVMEPLKEQVANLVTCTYGDPGAPQIAPGRSVSQILTIAVFTGEEGAYFAGAVAQAKDAFDLGRKNAASAQAVSGLGEDGYWDAILRGLHVLKGKHELTVTVESDGGLNLARGVAEKALAKIP
jgi:hypothetical protein